MSSMTINSPNFKDKFQIPLFKFVYECHLKFAILTKDPTFNWGKYSDKVGSNN
jgi:hypothetical protein